MIRLLVLSCGTNANYHITKTLKERFGDVFCIIGIDINKRWQISNSIYLDAFFQCPLSSEEGYYQFVLDVCRKNKIDCVLPSYDGDQLLFYDGNPDLVEMNIISLGICSQIKDVYKNKMAMNNFLSNNHFLIPRVFSKTEISNEEVYFVKPMNGNGSIGTRLMYGKEIGEEVISSNLIEEVCCEPEITLECFLYKGKVYSVARQRLAQKSGVCTKAKVYNDKELTAIAQHFADMLPLPHIFNLQFMCNSRGEYVITDVNLRPAGGMSLSFAAGWDEVGALANVMLHSSDEEVIKHVQPVVHEQYVMRAYSDIVTKKVEKRIAFDLDGTLLDSRKRHEIVMDDVLSEFGIELATDDLLPFKLEGHTNIDWLVQKGIDKGTARSVQKRWVELIEKENYLFSDKLYEGIIPYLEQLSKTNELFLITGRNNASNAKKQIAQLGISQFFTEVKIVSSNPEISKAKAGFLIENKIDEMVGDTESDLKAARMANCKFKAVVYGFRSEVFWNQYHVEYLEK